MKFYRLEILEGGTSRGFEHFTTKDEAEKCLRHNISKTGEGHELEIIEIEPTKVGILSALKRYASHPDNG